MHPVIVILLIVGGVCAFVGIVASLASSVAADEKKEKEEKKLRKKEVFKQEMAKEIVDDFVKEQKAKEKKDLIPAIEGLRAIITCRDEVSELLESIVMIGQNVLAYKTKNEVIPEIVNLHKAEIEEYLTIATIFATRFRTAKNYLNERDYSTLEQEIKELRDVRDKATRKILREKRALLRNIKNIKRSKDNSILGLKEIDIVLKSLEASITQVEVQAVPESQAKDEISRTLSSLRSALDEVFKSIDKDEALVEKELKRL